MRGVRIATEWYITNMTDPKPKLRWYQLTLWRFLLIVLAIEASVFVLAKCHWFGFIKDDIEVTSFFFGFWALVILHILAFVWALLPFLVRRRFQYSLRSLMLVMLLTSVCMSGFATKRFAVKQQEEAAEAIKKLGGDVRWDGCLVRNSDFFSDVTDVEFINRHVAVAALQRLRDFPHLRWLALDGSDITDTQLKHLQCLKELQCLDLQGTGITDSGLEHIKVITSLRSVQLQNTPVTNAGVRNLQKALPNCEVYH
jgi:hypothetical protein